MMKIRYRYLKTPALLLLSALPSFGVTLSWSANIEPDLLGYKVYQGTAPATYGPPTTVGIQTSHVVSGLNPGSTYYFALTAFDTSGNESGFSNEIAYLVPPIPPPQGGETITIGETNILTSTDSGNGNLLLAQSASLAQSGTLQNFSFYVVTASGQLRLGIYDATGPGGGPGALRGETAAFTPIPGWNIAPVVTPSSLQAGTYWLAYHPSSSSLSFKTAQNGTSRYYARTFGPLPTTFSTTPSTYGGHWSFYATLTTGALSPPPTLTLSVNPLGIISSQSATLAWTSGDATSVSIDQGIGSVGLSGSRQVTPASTTTYTATATGAGGVTTATATVTVTPASPVVDLVAPNGICVRVNGLLVFGTNCP